MRILITGNTGYIGATLAQQLRRSYPDAHITGLDAGWFAHCLTTRGAWPDLSLDEQRYGDVRDVTVEDLKGVDAVICLSAVSNDPMGNRFEAVTDDINHTGAPDNPVQSVPALKKSAFLSTFLAWEGLRPSPRLRRDPPSNRHVILGLPQPPLYV